MPAATNTRIVVCPIGAFGSPGTQAGAELVADALQELLDDNAAETRPHRARAYRDRVELHELAFDTPAALADWHTTGRAAAKAAFDASDFVIWVGGNHLSLLPVYEELAERAATVVQFDAHLDLYNLGDSQSELNHGNFLRHAARLPDLINVGHRDLFLPPSEVARYFRAAHAANTDPAVINRTLTKRGKSPVFLDIDCDVFDPAFFPAIAHPLPFGLSPAQVLRHIEAVWSPRVIGVGVSEFDPGRDVRDQSLAMLIWLLEWLLLRRYEE